MREVYVKINIKVNICGMQVSKREKDINITIFQAAFQKSVRMD